MFNFHTLHTKSAAAKQALQGRKRDVESKTYGDRGTDREGQEGHDSDSAVSCL